MALLDKNTEPDEVSPMAAATATARVTTTAAGEHTGMHFELHEVPLEKALRSVAICKVVERSLVAK